ncbi:MAG: hypothetical protein BRD55_05805 [Bacteroidetes bacterium SW_9_63_38]|nr:MAG: hypothetical protein BRD55_05805 [Bacteroidetes bacterium SW_9_63_38]
MIKKPLLILVVITVVMFPLGELIADVINREVSVIAYSILSTVGWVIAGVLIRRLFAAQRSRFWDTACGIGFGLLALLCWGLVIDMIFFHPSDGPFGRAAAGGAYSVSCAFRLGSSPFLPSWAEGVCCGNGTSIDDGPIR